MQQIDTIIALKNVGIINPDLKRDNLIKVNTTNANVKYKMTDFGILCRIDGYPITYENQATLGQLPLCSELHFRKDAYYYR